MKLTKLQLQQLIKEEVTSILNEADPSGLPWQEDEEEIPEYEYVLDELVNAAYVGVLPLVTKKLKEAGSFSDAEGGKGLTLNDIQLQIEEPLMDALKPLAKIIQAKINNAKWERAHGRGA